MTAADAGGEEAEELVEWLDDDGQVIDVVPRSRMRREHLLHRSVAIIVQSTDGRLLIHQRSATKDLRPGWWDVAAGGVVTAGEAVVDAAHRELGEEVGLDDVELEWVATERFDGSDWREICDLFRTTHDGPFTFADGEIERAALVTPDELATLALREQFLESIRVILPHVAGFEVSPSIRPQRDRSSRRR